MVVACPLDRAVETSPVSEIALSHPVPSNPAAELSVDDEHAVERREAITDPAELERLAELLGPNANAVVQGLESGLLANPDGLA